jgi:hypothetical protein
MGTPRLVLLMLAVTVVKLTATALVGSTADVAQTLAGAQAVLASRDVLDPANTGGNPLYFLMGHAYIAAACLLVAEALAVPFDVVIKAPAILADLGVALLLATAVRGGTGVALVYLLSPVTLLLSVYHGQLHTVATAGAVFALWLGDRARHVAGGIVLGLATAVRQHFGALIIPLGLRAGRRSWALVVGFGVTLLVLNLPLLAAANPGRVLTPLPSTGIWGYAIALQHGPRALELLGFAGAGAVLVPLGRAVATYGPWLYWLWLAVFGAWAWRRRDADPWRAALVFLLGFYVVGPGFGVQWLVWALPFWLMVDRRGALGYTALASAYLVASYWQWGLNAKYRVWSVTANLHLLEPLDLAGLFLVGVLGLATWAYCAGAGWRLARA